MEVFPDDALLTGLDFHGVRDMLPECPLNTLSHPIVLECAHNVEGFPLLALGCGGRVDEVLECGVRSDLNE